MLYRIIIQYAMYKPFKLMIMRNVFIGYFIVFAQYINTFVSIKKGFSTDKCSKYVY